MTEQICMGCMTELHSENGKCTHCGYPVGGVNPPEYLRVRTVLDERYLVGRVLEISGDSAVYIGKDMQDGSTVTVREFFPGNLCRREADGSLVSADAAFNGYKAKFLSNARAVARLRDVLAVVPSFDIFEQNGTAYSVSEYCEGVSLERYVSNRGPLSYEQARRMFLPLISAMAAIHAAGVLHLGICPKNVLVDVDGRLRLKNFCIPETRTVDTACKPVIAKGYCAPEQYTAGALRTEAADVYALTATLYFALTGVQPTDAAVRMKKGGQLLMPANVADALPDHVKDSMNRALRIDADRRTASAQQLWDELTATPAVAALIDEEEVHPEPKPRKSGLAWLWLTFVAMVLVLAGLAVFVLHQMGFVDVTAPFRKPTATTAAPTTTVTSYLPSTTTRPTTVPTQPITGTYEVPSLLGKTANEAKTTYLGGGLTVYVKGFEYNDAAKGTVLSQDIPAGTRVEKNTRIGIIVSAGPETFKMPDVSGWSEEHARLYLEALGLTVKTPSLPLEVSKDEKGTVDRTTPAAGNSVSSGDSVTLWVSNVDKADPTE